MNILYFTAMYCKLAFGEHFYSEPETEGPTIELNEVIPASLSSGRSEKQYFHELQVTVVL